ncbi:DNA polymerase theta [Geosmithia morbida]|uniref:DNA polymerase theta n=1 Tax=Geosmithia morbida TaxID=1094350 RepID=A0A9P5D170_9HYPO|nr:DNA polymerase theta [Geosmithia morbida]KAF4123558.1 DNA polymerase theta [Geosmithia morbida]
MNSMQGLLHETTLQSAQGGRSTSTTGFSGTLSASTGQKRSWSDGDSNNSHYQDSNPAKGGPAGVQFQRTISFLPGRPKRLSASRIVNCDNEGEGEGEGISEYSQRQAISATPTSTIDPELSLSHPTYDLPAQLVDNFASVGIKQIYPWQKNCLKGPRLLEGTKNLVYCAPTGGGKSLVADLLMLKRVLEEKGSKALLVLPYVALVQEKVRWLRKIVQGLQYANTQDEEDKPGTWARRADEDFVRVIGFFGGGKVRATWADFDIGVCTMEKANSLVNAAIDDCVVQQLRAVVLDELHMIDDDHRGYLLELMTTKLMSLEQPVQIIAMSATLPNMDLMARWIDAHSYETRYRPVPIHEHLVCSGRVYPAASTGDLIRKATQLSTQNSTQSRDRAVPTRLIDASEHKEFRDPVLNAVVTLALETASSGFGVLVFASSRAMAEGDARWISRAMPEPQDLDPKLLDKRTDLLSELRSLSTGLDPVLEETVIAGVAFHRNPARRVILHGARMGRDLVGPALLRQMRGRAGRQGRVPVGETYLCCSEDDLESVVELMHADLPEVTSCLNAENHRLQRALLEVIAIRLATSHESILGHFKKSLLWHTHGTEYVSNCVEISLKDMEEAGFITRDMHSQYAATQLGKAIVSSAIDPDDGIFIHKELSRALRSFVMDGDMHILYTFTPVQDFGVPVNWQIFRNEMEMLDDSGMRVLACLGIKPTTVQRLAQGAALKTSSPEEKEMARVYARFYLALQLRDLCNEMPVHAVARKYDMPRGAVQNLSQTCQGFAAGMIKFCVSMGWGVLAAALDHFSDRLLAGARTDLLELAKIPFIKSRTAYVTRSHLHAYQNYVPVKNAELIYIYELVGSRVFWESGFRSAGTIASVDPKELVPVLMQAQPNKIRLKEKDVAKYEEKLLAKATIISASANKIWRTYAR